MDRSLINTRFSKQAEQVQDEARRNVYLMQITEEGVYRITADQLSSAGIPTDAAAAQSIKIFGRGGTELSETVDPPTNNNLLEQAIIVNTNGNGQIQEILFYASGPSGFHETEEGITHYIHHYDTKAGYLLTYGGGPGLRAVAREAHPRTRGPQPPECHWLRLPRRRTWSHHTTRVRVANGGGAPLPMTARCC